MFLCIVPRDTSRLAPCDHEEADSRQMLHLTNAIDEGYQKILIRTVDTDVVVLGIAAAANSGVRELWLSFGTDSHHRYIPAHEIAASIGPRKSLALPFFHAFTGCDTGSAFHKREKKPACDTWKAYDEVTQTFLSLRTSRSIDRRFCNSREVYHTSVSLHICTNRYR